MTEQENETEFLLNQEDPENQSLIDEQKLNDNLTENETDEEYENESSDERNGQRSFTDYKNPTYNLISIVAYLIGVEKKHFENEHTSPKFEIYQELEKNKSARIIRNLCRVRTCFEKYYIAISKSFMYDMKNIGTLPEYISQDAVSTLNSDGVELYKSRPKPDDYIIAINKEISNRINNVKSLFPEWIEWNYIRPIFIMPNGMTPEGLKIAGAKYNSDRNRYPYHCYINWPGMNNGNILHCDEKFTRLLYQLNEDSFDNISLVRDVGDIALGNLYSFICDSQKAIVAVDCENSDPIKLAAVLAALPQDEKERIHSVLLFESEYTTSAWKLLSRPAIGVNLPVEHIEITRLNQHKSLVDMSLAVRICKEVYGNGVDSILLVSSDSDYWALIQSLADIKFLVMVESEKCGNDIKNALQSKGIFYCYMDDFYTGSTYNIKLATLLGELRERMDAMVSFNINKLLDDVIKSTWVQMTPKERSNFYDRYLKRMRLIIDSDGNAKVQFDG